MIIVLLTVYADFNHILLLKKGQLSEAQKKAEQGIIFSSRHEHGTSPAIFFRLESEAQILLNDVDGAKESLLKAKKIIDQHKFLAPIYTFSPILSLNS